ncbi:phospho-sugar mutase [Alkaliphilus peptidifermentans]|uniref:phosphoglucomutase (alpha-D-glucose-1,6-bisphosphate-dependent) n=1 Tax=Alkaliphilus peptidifermentans DSM 18978 TaxID=1120976 RepID=A0A1G5JFD5_9FIRM|nr:phospho-sugar mutase [Alkaliphilus peptidifermentans]SCY87083.1 alpha-phosphoglucomutase [Alkaliphilus peptidifermentans DSM 18978]
MDLRTIKNYELWLTDSYFDEATRRELIELQGNEKEIEDRFYKDLEFGTGGIRGIVGAGTNRMNRYTVGKATQGLANYIVKYGEEAMKRGVVIAYDSRHMSKEFCEEAALILAANDIPAYIFEDLRPTPELSFAVRELNAIAGIVITASHNPAPYNGYKVYWEDGAQITSQHALGIIKEISEIYDLKDIYRLNREIAEAEGLLNSLGKEMDDLFIEAVKKQSLRPEVVKNIGEGFKVIYTPLHGTGSIPVRRVLEEIGFKSIISVKEQDKPDPNFSTVKYPNPEERDAFTYAIELANKESAQLIIGTDPDCDRVGAVVKNKDNEFVVLTGNQTGALLVEYILGALKEKRTLPQNGVIIKTIVTSEIGAVIAKAYGIDVLNTLTGFKYIGEKIKHFQESKEYTYILGYEESYGYLIGTHARDKDAVVASMLICEMAAYYHNMGMSLYDALQQLYKKYGYYQEGLKSITLEGKEGMEKIQRILETFRNDKMQQLGELPVRSMEDYLLGKRFNYVDKTTSELDFPKADVIKFILEDNNWVALRPSGTEPKLKIYAGVKGKTLENAVDLLETLMLAMEEKIL